MVSTVKPRPYWGNLETLPLRSAPKLSALNFQRHVGGGELGVPDELTGLVLKLGWDEIQPLFDLVAGQCAYGFLAEVGHQGLPSSVGQDPGGR